MFKNKIVKLIIGIVILLSQQAFSQDSTETIMFRAMKDELDRSMKKLICNDCQAPFYIAYSIEDVKTIFTTASLGSLSNASERHYRSWSNRVLVGDYQLNDENFTDATRAKAPRDGDLELPLDNDYYGIRRALWMMTNNTYKSAAENYKNKIASLKDKNLSQKDLQIPDFCRVPVVKMSIPDKNYSWNKEYLQKLVKDVSTVFKDYPDIFYSEVAAFQVHANIYFYSSENCQIQTPIDLVYIMASALSQATDGDNVSAQVRYSAVNQEDLPKIENMQDDARALAQNLIERGKASILDENYSGPVLFLGQAVAEAFSQGFFTGTDNLIAYREPLYNSSQMSMFYGQNINSVEAKLDKPVIAKDLTVKDLSRLKTYHGVNLVGSYDVDGEGVVPPDTLTLIEKGVLKSLYNGRTPTRNIKESNGHNRYSITKYGGITHDLGPGVIFVTATDGTTIDKLKEQLIKTAKENDLDYAIMIKPIKQGNFYMPLNIYKVSVADGKETLLRDASMKSLNIASLKKIIGVSSGSLLYNTFMNENSENEEGGSMIDNQEAIPNGPPVSFIVPDGILIKEVDFDHQTKPLSSDRPVVKSPLLNLK
jgi:PmbA/TldA metallopeptidase C-terminal domain